ncbi:hypothetical protein WUBG_09579, partial [Wuchereria bancrofti]
MATEIVRNNFPIISTIRQQQQQFYKIKEKISNLFEFIKNHLPIIYWLPKYNWRNSFFGDVSGGLTMAVLAIPQGIAHSALTEVEPVHSLYTAIFLAFFYILFGTSRHNSLGGFAILSLMTHSIQKKVMLFFKVKKAIQKVMLKYNKLKNETNFENNDEIFDYFNNTLPMDFINGTNSNFPFSKSSTDLNNLKPIHMATAIMFTSGF